jgi:adenylosuccinate synthase
MILRDYRFLHPERDIKKDLLLIGRSKQLYKTSGYSVRPNTGSVVGAALGDEGKGRIIDNKIGAYFSKSKIKTVVVIRFQGGTNSGHTVQVNDTHLALHQIPCGIMYKHTICIMDRGMTISPVDLIDEIHTVERVAGSLKGRLFLSQDAVLNTDLDRAEEFLNRIRQGKAGGGTGKGIGPSYAHHYDRLGFHVYDLMDDDWRKKLSSQYKRYNREFAQHGLKLSAIDCGADFKNTKLMKNNQKRPVGSLETFLRRLADARKELLSRRMIQNIFPMHKNFYEDPSCAVLFEGAQALGLHPWLGTIPDTTASDTSTFGVQPGTGFWKATDIDERIGVFKIPYTSSVGARLMPTQADDEWATRVREEAHEYGTTTGRPRDILYLDLAMLAYNIRMSGIEKLAGTHLDISWEDIPIPVCTHYTNKKGNVVPYQPGLRYLAKVIPHYIKLPGWNGGLVRKAKTFKALPENAKKFLVFLERRLGVPIVAVTTGPARDNYIKILS